MDSEITHQMCLNVFSRPFESLEVKKNRTIYDTYNPIKLRFLGGAVTNVITYKIKMQ